VTSTPSKPAALAPAAPSSSPENTPKKLFGSSAQRTESPEKVSAPSYVKPAPAAPSSSSKAPPPPPPSLSVSPEANNDGAGPVRRSSIADRIAALQANGASSASSGAANPPPPVEKKEVPPPPPAAPVVKPIVPPRQFVPPPPPTPVPSSSAANNSSTDGSEQNPAEEKKTSVADRIAALKAKGTAAAAAESANNEPQPPAGGMGRRMSQDKFKIAGSINLAGFAPGGPRPVITKPKEEPIEDAEMQHVSEIYELFCLIIV
jgi:hypothetical protein